MALGQAAIWTAVAVKLVLKPISAGLRRRAGWDNTNLPSTGWRRTPAWQSMPPGEAAILGAAFGILWVLMPRWRWLYLAVGLLEALGLVWFQWHFASDVIAGSAIDILGAVLALKQMR